MFGFGKKKNEGRTLLLLDVENGSVGAALVRLMPEERPKLFGERRVQLPVGMSRTGAGLAHSVEGALEEALRDIAEVAARIRLHAATADMGTLEKVSVIMAPPWGKPNLEAGRPDFLDSMTGFASGAIQNTFGAVPVSFYTSAGAAAYGTRALFGTEPCIVCIVTGEMTELLLMDEEGVVAHATLPLGTHALVRTLKAHGGYSEAEARSAARLPFDSSHLKEPFRTAASHFAEQFKNTARDLISPGEYSQLRVIGHEPAGEWFARALSRSDSLAELFPQGEVRALRAQHLTPFVAAHAEVPDTMLLLGALFIDSQRSL